MICDSVEEAHRVHDVLLITHRADYLISDVYIILLKTIWNSSVDGLHESTETLKIVIILRKILDKTMLQFEA